jgi:hypothetical protein
MKRFLLVLILCLIPYLSFASGPQVLVQGTATGTTQIRLSTVDGTAFLDGDGTVPCTSFIGEKIEIVDSAGKKISGFVKAAGSVEGLSATEKITNGDMELDSNWTVRTGTPTTNERSNEQAHGGTYSRKLSVDAQYELVRSDYLTSVIGGLFKAVVNVYGDGTNKFISRVWAIAGHNYAYFPLSSGVAGYAYPASWTTETAYVTFIETNPNYFIEFGSGTGVTTGTIYFDDVSFKQVTAPSSTGCTIVSTSGGTTYNWSKETGFDPNSASFKWRILSTNIPGKQIAGGSLTAANVRLATVDGGAMVHLTDVDLSSYAGDDTGGPLTIINPKSTRAATMTTNKYLLALYSASGICTMTIGAVGGGEALAAEKSTGTCTAGNLYKITATEVNHFYTGCAVGEYFTSVGTETCDASNKVQEVTEVEATGLHGHSTANGTDRKMSLKTTGFDPNAVTSYKIYRTY